MFLVHIVFVLCICSTINHVLGSRQEYKMRRVETEDEDDKKVEEADVHTFVALIDIIFTDYSKRTCTGTIIHDNVVITAAHCFTVENKPHIQPELTASFVVIGTKKMFESKYEQYLPIEKVIVHPKFRGWTADLALVYTFSGMTSDKPGTTIPLDGERTSTPVDSNVTVLSWGHCTDDDLTETRKPVTKIEKYNAGDNVYDWDSDGKTLRAVKRVDSVEFVRTTKNQNSKPFYRYSQQHGSRHKVNAAEFPRAVEEADLFEKTTNFKNRYISSGIGKENEEGHREARRQQFKQDSPELNTTITEDSYPTTPEADVRTRGQYRTRRRRTENRTRKRYNFQSVFRNWRRSMGSQQNRLTVEVFGFVNMQACKKIVERAMPAIYEIKDSNDVVCYASEEHYITAEDSGAPAIRLGHLVAVTVGGAECDGDHVAIGMKMSCYCTWITENLPVGAKQIKCCKNCCDVKYERKNGDHKMDRYGNFRGN